jgi:hypothetical protein
MSEHATLLNAAKFSAIGKVLEVARSPFILELFQQKSAKLRWDIFRDFPLALGILQRND